METTNLFIVYFSLFASIFILSFGFFISTSFPNIKIVRLFFTICLLLSGINFIEFQMKIAETQEEADLWNKTFSVWPYILSTSLHFILLFRYEIKKTLLVNILLYAPAICISYMDLTTGAIYTKPILTEWGYTVTLSENIYSQISIFWTIIMLILIFYFSYFNYSISEGNKKKQAKLIFIGIVINFAIGITTDLIWKMFEITGPNIGYASSVISFGLIGYSIKKYQLFELTPESIAGKIIHSTSDFVILINSKKNIVEINPSTLQSLDYTRDEIINKNIETIIFNGNELCNKHLKNKKTNTISDFEVQFISSKNKKIPISLSCNPIPIQNSYDHGFVLIGRDVTERKKAEAKLQNENSKLEDLVSKRTENLSKINAQLITEINKYDKSEKKLLQTIQKLEQNERDKISFFDNLAHEISTPVNAIIGFSDLIKEHDITKTEVHNFASIIYNSSIQLQGIVKNIVSLATLNNNKETINIEEINCNYILQSIYNQFKPRAEKQKLEFACFKKLTDEEALINTDQIKFIQIITNLLNNAFKFTKVGYIHFGYTISSDKITFFVRDTGIGISDKNKEIIFERYSQGNPTISELYGGSGLGLSIAKTYVELLGGEIWLESDVNKGSNFNFWLPYTYKSEETH